MKNLRDREKAQTHAGYQRRLEECDWENILHLQRRRSYLRRSDRRQTCTQFIQRARMGPGPLIFASPAKANIRVDFS